MDKLRKTAGFTLIELMIVVAIIGILAAIAIPNFIKFQVKAKQSEARSNAKAMITAQKAFQMAKDRYSMLPLEAGFLPERNNRYAYFFAQTVVLEDRSAASATGGATATAIGVDTFRGHVAVPAPGTLLCGTALTDLVPGSESWTGAAVGNVDNDPTLDQWSVSTDGRTLPAGCDATGPVAAGEPANEQNDVNR